MEEEDEDDDEYQPDVCVAGGWVVTTASLVTCVIPAFYFIFAMPLLVAPPILIFVAGFGCVGVLFGLSYTQPGVFLRSNIRLVSSLLYITVCVGLYVGPFVHHLFLKKDKDFK